MMRATLAFGLLLAACEVAPPARTGVSAPASSVPADPAQLEPEFIGLMRAAERDYRAWGRVDEMPRVAPAPCADVRSSDDAAGRPGHVRLSAAEAGPHGKKLYYLWTNHANPYLAGGEVPIGFTIVKESFAALAGGRAPAARHGDEPVGSLIAADGQRLLVGPRKALFVMTKVAATSRTDDGWVYGTVAVDGTVTSAGRVASCMGCHDRDPAHDKLFGLAPAPQP